jgi:hypothetical protein
MEVFTVSCFIYQLYRHKLYLLTNLEINFNRVCSYYYPKYISSPLFMANTEFRVSMINQTDQLCIVMDSAHWLFEVNNQSITGCWHCYPGKYSGIRF